MALSRSQPPPRAPERVVGGRYHVLDELGRGGMGAVFRVRDAVSGRELALKQLTTRDSGTAVSLFEREYYVLAQLAHPRVISVYDYGHDAAGPFYTMELLEGADLRALAPLPVARACALVIDVCSSLALLHARRLVHRDVSPRNIRCTRDGHAKLIDFGAMSPMGPSSQSVGTPAFIAPEVVSHSELDARADLFSLGATLYYALTGRSPFPARQLSELREIWSAELVLPSRWVKEVPPALDELCAGLLSIDPGQRPGSAFEVIQRLQIIAGIPAGEQDGSARAFLSTPALVGRDDVLRRFRQGMRRALHGQGSAWMFEGEGGLGRSRVLDACMLEAKTLGALVVRAAASVREKSPLAVAQQLVERLVQFAPELARGAALQLGIGPLLFDAAGGLRALGEAGVERATLQSALSSWIAKICEGYALVLVVDDVQASDEASIALLAELAIEAHELRLLIALSSDRTAVAAMPAALAVLTQKCKIERLRALSAEQTAALVASVFGNVPNVRLLADRLFKLATGNPRETLALAQNLVDTGAVHYDQGRWTLPNDLDADALPATAAEAFAARVRALPPLARSLAEAQALVGTVLRREDYAMLASDADPASLNAAVLLLLERQVIQCDGEFYGLSHRGLSEALCALLEPAQRRARHLALYELFRARPDRNQYLLVHHLLEAEQYEQAFAPFANPEFFTETEELDATLRAGAEHLTRTLESALELSLRLARPARETYEIRRLLCGIATRGDGAVYAKVSPAWLAQLELDSGLADYRALSAELGPQTRLQTALGAAAARHAATPARDRVYRVDEAIKHLGMYVVCSIVAGARARDPELLATLPGLLEPFAPLSPVMFALWHNALATHELYSGSPVRARDRWSDVYERLGQIPPEAFSYLADIRRAAARGITTVEALLGRASTLEWAAKFEIDPLQRVDAMYFRRLVCLMYGDTEEAERFGQQAELFSLRLSARPYFVPAWTTELLAACALRDLVALKRVIDAIVPLAERYPAWNANLSVARAEFELLRGDPAAAHSALRHALSLAHPDGSGDPRWIDVWCNAVAGSIAVAIELGDAAEACALGRRALELCERRGFEIHWFRVAQRLALAEMKLGDLPAATARIERLIGLQRRLGARGLLLAQSHVIRTQIAVMARDSAAIEQHAALALAEPGGSKLMTQAVQRDPLLADAKRAGIDLALTPTAFEASVLGTTQKPGQSPEAARLRAALDECASGPIRVARALELVCELADAEAGYLYLVDAVGQLELAARRHVGEPDVLSLQFARGFFAQQVDDEALSAGLTRATYMLSLPGAATYRDPRGSESQLFMLTCKDRDALVYVGLAVLQTKASAQPAARLPSLLSVIADALLRAGDSPGVRADDI